MSEEDTDMYIADLREKIRDDAKRNGIPYAESVEEMPGHLKRPEGSVSIYFPASQLFVTATDSITLDRIIAGAMIFILERGPNLKLHFIHSSPGTGTRVATLDLTPLAGCKVAEVRLGWSPEKISLFARDVQDPDRHIGVEGTPVSYQLQVCPDGSILQSGDEGCQVMGTRAIVGGKPLVIPTAINTWKDTVDAIEILLKGSSPDGFIFEIICCNLSIAMLVTGFETYCKQRFLELEEEGIQANFEELAKRFIPKKYRDNGLLEGIVQEAKTLGISPLKNLIDDKKINFQNYEKCKDAFSKGYGIRFSEDIGIPNETLEELPHIIDARHQIIHVSALNRVLNEDMLATEGPIISNKKYAKHAIDVFDGFIQGLHSATLKLRPV